MKIAKITGFVLLALILVILAFAATFDVGKYKAAIEAKAKDATGRTVTIGDIRLAASLTPTVTLTDVSVANAPWGTRPQMAVIKRLDVHAELLPLLTGRLAIDGVSLDQPDLWLETDARGRGNWEFGSPVSRSSDHQEGQNALSLGGIDIKGLKLSYKDRDRTATATAKALAVRGPLHNLVVRTLQANDLAIVLMQGKTETDLGVREADLTADGKITALGITNLALNDVTLLNKGEGSPFEASVAKLSLDKDGNLLFNGSLNGQDVRAAGSLAPVAVLAAVKNPFPAKLTIDGLGMKAETDLEVSVNHGRPTIKGKVSIPAFALAPAKPAKGEKAVVNAPTSGSQIFSDAALPWSALNDADAAVQVSLAKLTLPNGIVVSDVALPVDLAKGKLAVNDVKANLAGGTLTGSLTAAASDKSVAVKIEGAGLSAETIAKEINKSDLITQGPIDLHVDVRGKGNSLHAIMASLDGSLLAGMGESKIKNTNLNLVGGDLLQLVSAANPAGNQDPYTAARCGVANFQITDGVARTNNGIAFVTDKMQITSSGTVNLGTEQIDLAVHPKATGGLGIGLGALAQAIKVSGPLANPGVSIDKAGAAKSVGVLGLAFATGGTSLLAQGAKDRIAGGDACQAARKMGRK
jgi:uncharacterized protein involved in outer membrane biogenesis